MTPKQKIEQLFAEIKKGNFKVQDELFETLYVNFTAIAHLPEGVALMEEIGTWATAHQTEHPDLYVLSILSLGTIDFLGDNFDSALKRLNIARELFAKMHNEDGIAACTLTIGYVHRSTGEFDLALKFGLPGLEQLLKSGKFKMYAIIGCYWIGGLYADTGHFEEALKLFHQGLAIDFPAGIQSMGARIINGIASVYMKQKNFTLALENYQKALDLCDENTEFTFRARGLTDLGDYYFKMGDYSQAICYNTEALAIRQELNIANGSITNLINLGEIYSKQGKFDDAITVLQKALKLAEEIGVKVKAYQIHQLLSDIYLGMGEMPKSLAHFKSYHEIREDVNHEDLDRKVKNQVRLFQAKQTEKENTIIKAQKIEIEQKNIELQETIDELTLAKINKKARAFTLGIGIILFIFQDRILEHILHLFASDNYLLSICIKVAIIFSLEPVNKTIEHYLLRRVIKKNKKEVVV